MLLLSTDNNWNIVLYICINVYALVHDIIT